MRLPYNQEISAQANATEVIIYALSDLGRCAIGMTEAEARRFMAFLAIAIEDHCRLKDEKSFDKCTACQGKGKRGRGNCSVCGGLGKFPKNT